MRELSGNNLGLPRAQRFTSFQTKLHPDANAWVANASLRLCGVTGRPVWVLMPARAAPTCGAPATKPVLVAAEDLHDAARGRKPHHRHSGILR